MAATTPFSPMSGATAGKGVVIYTSAANSSIAVVLTVTGGFPESLMVSSAAGSSFSGSGATYVRISSEASPTATAADVLIPANSVRLFANPSPGGNLGVAVFVTASHSAVISVTPGQGGI